MDPERRRRRISEGTARLLLAKATATLHCNEAAAHLKAEHYQEALDSYTAALKLNSSDKNALVARSKCHILLGNPEAALEDAETALGLRKNYIPALYQKAEAFYHLGNFEYSLMYYHRGLQLRPLLEHFRLGVQKAQEAIINTIGPTVKLAPIAEQCKEHSPKKLVRSDTSKKMVEKGSMSSSSSMQRPSTSLKQSQDVKRPTSVPSSTKSSGNYKQTLGALSIDKMYLERLIHHPQLKFSTNKNKAVLKDAQAALGYLKVRERFWEEQLAPLKLKKR